RKDLFAQGGTIERQNDSFDQGLLGEIHNLLMGPHQEQRHRELPHQGVGDAADPKTLQQAASVRRHDDEIRVRAGGRYAQRLRNLAFEEAACYRDHRDLSDPFTQGFQVGLVFLLEVGIQRWNGEAISLWILSERSMDMYQLDPCAGSTSDAKR